MHTFGEKLSGLAWPECTWTLGSSWHLQRRQICQDCWHWWPCWWGAALGDYSIHTVVSQTRKHIFDSTHPLHNVCFVTVYEHIPHCCELVHSRLPNYQLESKPHHPSLNLRGKKVWDIANKDVTVNCQSIKSQVSDCQSCIWLYYLTIRNKTHAFVDSFECSSHPPGKNLHLCLKSVFSTSDDLSLKYIGFTSTDTNNLI